MLEDDGYVSLSQGRSAVVTYGVRAEVCRERYISYSYATKEALLDLNRTMLMIWPEAMLQGLRLCGERELRHLSGLINRMTARIEYPFFEFFFDILNVYGNPLLLNLYQSTILFGHCSLMFAGDQEYIDGYIPYLKKTCRKLLSLRRAEEYEELKALLIQLYQEQITNNQKYFASLPPSPEQGEPIAYHWDFYTERPLVGFDLAMKLLRKVYSSYQKMDFLPSYSAIAEKYSMPVMTVRRAIKILSEIGVVETINGKGTRVLVGCGSTVQYSSLSSPTMKKVLLPYLQSVQILVVVSRDIARSVFPTFTESMISVSIDELYDILAAGDCAPVLGVCFRLLLSGGQSPALTEILNGLLYFQYLGYPLKDLDPFDFRSDLRTTRALLKSLRTRNAELFAEHFQLLMRNIFQAGREKLLTGGVTEVETIAVPPV